MSYVQGVTFSVVALAIGFPGLLILINLLMGKVAERAALRLGWTPLASFLVGLPVSLLFVAIIGGASDAGRTAVAMFFLAFVLLFWALGMAGMARLLGERIQQWGGHHSAIGGLLRGAAVLSLAIFMPLVGWFIVLPVTLVIGVGAACFALVGWVPRKKIEKAHAREAALNAPAAPAIDMGVSE